MEIKQKLIPANNKETRPGLALNPNYITIHETDNTNKGADADAHARLQVSGNSRNASWHYTVDDHEIWQSIPDDEVAWHAGDGKNGPGNRKSLSIEICVNQDGNFEKAKQNAAWLTRYLMNKHKISINHVVQHHKWSGKNCPRKLRASGWNEFINQVRSGSDDVVENMYDLSYFKEYKLIGIRSSKHPSEIHEKITWAMEANANCVLLLKRGFDLRLLQKTLNDMYPPNS
jgi:N-acetylmuramoyl-L-alanine amidase